MAIRLISGRLQQRSKYCAKQQQFLTENSMRYTLQLTVATTCGRKHKPHYYTTQEDRLTDQR